MSLDYTDRGILEKIIEHEIENIPIFLSKFRDLRIKSEYQITNPEEFCYGRTYGTIIARFEAYYSSNHNANTISDKVMKELGEIVQKHLRDIKDAIFNCG
jgi:hypothetical protein